VEQAACSISWTNNWKGATCGCRIESKPDMQAWSAAARTCFDNGQSEQWPPLPSSPRHGVCRQQTDCIWAIQNAGECRRKSSPDRGVAIFNLDLSWNPGWQAPAEG
jgi:hypothetical protein